MHRALRTWPKVFAVNELLAIPVASMDEARGKNIRSDANDKIKWG